MDGQENPHHAQPLRQMGAPLEEARAAAVLLHGRGATAEDILYLAEELDQPEFAYLAPQAAGNTWYPYRFLAPLEQNEPHLSSALEVVARTLLQVVNAGIPLARTLLLGFSQGACLALEYAARRPQRYGGVVGLSGGLIGPQVDPGSYRGSLAGTPVYLGCSDVDFHIPRERVEESAVLFQGLGAAVTLRLYPGMGHTINQDELDVVAAMHAAVLAQE